MAPINAKPSRTAAAKQITRKRHVSKSTAPLSESEESDDEHYGPQQMTGSLFQRTSTSQNFFGQQTFGVSDAAEDNEDIDMSDLSIIASRVGREVDLFAETLDQFKDELANLDSQRDAALQLVTSWRDYAVDQARELRSKTQLQKTRSTFDGSVLSSKGSRSVLASVHNSMSVGTSRDKKELNRWQGEADTWDLMRALLRARYPGETEKRDNQEKLEALGKVHKYLSSGEIWQAFVLSDNVVRERQLVLKWLEQVAEHSSEDLAQEKSPWANGWMETRERIKGAKRMRIGHERDIEVRSGQDLLVSSLDPDAPSRQGRALEKGDLVREKETWEACFRMLRQGKSWDIVREWLVTRNQGWRSISLGIGAEEKSPICTSGPASGTLWRKVCLIAARSKTNNEFEAAVYGLLAGDLESVERVCKTWDDHIFAHYNSLLLTQLDAFSLRFHDLKLPHDLVDQHGLAQSGVQPDRSAQDIVGGLKRNPDLANELRSPAKLIQSNLLGGNFPDLCQGVSAAVADEAWKDEPSAVIKQVNKSPSSNNDAQPEAAMRNDPNDLRIMAHALIVMRSVDQAQFASCASDELDNIIAGYIQLLRAAGKNDLIPLYASIMAEDRCVTSLAQVIADEVNARDRVAFIRLMQIYHIDTIAVLTGQYEYQLGRVLASDASPESGLNLIEDTTSDMCPGKRIKLVQGDIAVTSDEESLVDGLSVFYLVEGHWSITFEALARTCGSLLATEKFACASALVTQIQFEQLSVSKSAATLDQAVNVFDPRVIDEIETSSPELLPRLRQLQRDAQAYHDMSLLVNAVLVLQDWRKLEHDYASRSPKPTSVPSKLKKGLEELKLAMDPILRGVLLEAKDVPADQAQSFRTILKLYIPDTVIAYISALCTAAHMVSRDELLTAMDLATIVADENNGLARAFNDAGRMSELVKVFAETSKIMLKLHEHGRKKPEKKRGHAAGKDPGIWEIYG